MIGGEITVRVIEVKGNTVRLGIDAPRQVPVLRSELRSNGQRSTADCL
jgi:carbon storage regulator CsrA